MSDPEVGPEDPTTATAALTRPEELAPKPRREALTAFEVAVLVHELSALVGGYLDKAYQPSRQEVLLRFRAPAVGRRDLYIAKGGIACITENTPEMPTHPPGFAMALRKHACGGKVLSVEQHGYDRVITITVQRKEGEFRIVAELFGDGNVMLVRPDGRILIPLVTEAWAHRTIRGGAPYVPPPPRPDPRTFDEETFREACRRGNRDLVRALAMEAGLGGPVAEEVILRAGLDKKTLIEETPDEDLAKAYATWRDLIEEALTGTPDAEVLVESGRPVDWSAHHSLALTQEAAASADKEVVPAPSLSAALDRLFLAGRHTAVHQERIGKVDERTTKLARQRDEQEKAVKRFQAESVEKAAEGELLFAHYQLVEKIRQSILAARDAHDWKDIQTRIEEGKKSGNPEARRIVRVEPATGRLRLRLPDADGVEREVTVDITKSITENATAAYERAKKTRQKVAGAERALADTTARMEDAARDHAAATAAVDTAMERTSLLVPQGRHNWFEGYRWFYTSTGHLVVGGRDAASNDRLVKKHLESGDRYVHSEIHGAPSVIIEHRGDEEIPEQAMEEAAGLAVSWSRAFGRFAAADAYCVTPEQVSKTPQSGEFLAKGAFIVRGERKWVRKVPAVASLGLVWLDKEGRPTAPPDDPADPGALRAKIMAGPPDAVHAHTDKWVDLEPGDASRGAMTKRFARVFSAHPDMIERALPPGALRMTGSKGIDLTEEEKT
ncbi:MAG: NFACT family protein [Euryarchaeota archaeon]|nr:NFACT family protein [Euryarchaeota archaeon]